MNNYEFRMQLAGHMNVSYTKYLQECATFDAVSDSYKELPLRAGQRPQDRDFLKGTDPRRKDAMKAAEWHRADVMMYAAMISALEKL